MMKENSDDPGVLPSLPRDVWPALTSLIEARHFAAADRLVQAARARWPAAPAIDSMQGRVLIAAGRLDEARSVYEALLQRKERGPAVATTLGSILVRLNDIAGAKKALACADAEAEPVEGRLRLKMAIADADGDMGVVVDTLLSLRKTRSDEKLDFLLARGLAATDRLSEARSIYEALLERSQSRLPVATGLGSVLVRLGDVLGAKQALARAEMAAEPLEGRLRLQITIADAEGDAASAIESLFALRELTNNAKIDFELARAYLKLDDISNAAPIVRRVQEHSPDDPETLRLEFDLAINEGRRVNKPPAATVVELLRIPRIYKRAVQREGRVWGELLADPDRGARIARDEKAAEELRLNRDTPDVTQILRSRESTLEKGLSLGCGSGRKERELMSAGYCRSGFEGVDVAAEALTEATHIANAQQLPISYRSGDLNNIELPSAAYDLIVINTCLHHVLELEHVADQVARALRPGGVVWIQDFIGESRFQWSDKRLSIMCETFDGLPDELKWDDINQRRIEIRRPDPARLVSPFEAIRSEEIVPVFTTRFRTLFAHWADAMLPIVCRRGTRAAFAATAANRKRFEELFALDRTLLENSTLKPLGTYLLLSA